MTFNEFFSQLWFSYPKDLLYSTKGGKKVALEAAKKKCQPDDYQMILNSVQELAKYDRECRSKGLKVSGWPMLSTWINQYRWDREIEAVGELVERQTLPTCSTEGCDREVHGKRYEKCYRHLPDPMKDKRAQAAIKAGLMPKEGETRQDWLARCRQSARAGFNGVLKKPDYL